MSDTIEDLAQCAERAAVIALKPPAFHVDATRMRFGLKLGINLTRRRMAGETEGGREHRRLAAHLKHLETLLSRCERAVDIDRKERLQLHPETFALVKDYMSDPFARS